MSLSPDKTRVFITVNITEGAQYTVSSIGMSGELLLPRPNCGRSFVCNRRNILRTKLADSAKAISDRLGREGYAFASVNAVPELDREERTVAFNFVVDPGRRVYVRRINVAGNAQTRDEVNSPRVAATRSVVVRPEQDSAVQVRLDRLGFFSEVTLDNQPVPARAIRLTLTSP